MFDLISPARALCVALRAGMREFHTFAASIRASVVESVTVEDWEAAYKAAWDSLKETAGTPKDRKKLQDAVTDWEDTGRGNKAYHAWNDAVVADKVLTRMKVYRATVTKVLARVRDNVGADAKDTWQDVTADHWATMREHFKTFPNMYVALAWGENGGEPESPNAKPGNGPQNGGNGEGEGEGEDEAPKLAADDAEIVETVRLRYDDTAATAVENVLRSAAERKARKARETEAPAETPAE